MERGDWQINSAIQKTCRDRVREICDVQCPHHVICKLVELLSHSLSQNHHERHIELLNEYLRASKCGIWVIDICYIIELLEILSKKHTTVPEFEEPFKSVLQLIAIPPLLIRSSDVLHYKRDLEEYFTTLGKMFLYLPEEHLQLILMKSITSILKRKKGLPICCTSVHKCKEAVENSKLPEIFTNFLIIVNERVYDEFLKMYIMIAEISELICRRMVQQEAVAYLLTRLEPTWRTRLLLQQPPELTDDKIQFCHYKYTSKILWLLISAATKGSSEYRHSLCSLKEFPLWSLHSAFRATLCCQTKCEERNDFLAILIELTRIFMYVDFVKTGFAQDFAQLAIATEVTPSDPWLAKTRFTNSKRDYMFKLILMSFLPHFLNLCPNTQILEESGIIKGLIKILSKEQTVNWLPEQHCKLIWVSLNVLKLLVPEMPHDFAKINGHITVLNLLKSYQDQSYEVNIFTVGCQLLKRCIIVKQIDFLKMIHDEGGTTILLNLLEYLLREKFTISIQKALAYIFCCLEKLFPIKSTAHAKIVELNLKYLKRLIEINAPNDSYIHTQFVVCVLDFLWESVVWSDENLTEFIHRGGVYCLLDIFETKNVVVKLVAASALTDICEVEWSIPYFVTWRGKEGEGFLSVLLKNYQTISNLLGVKTTPDGCIEDLEYPIMGRVQKELFNNVQPMSSPAIADAFPTLRTKVYAMIKIIYHRYKDIVEAVRQHYHVNEELTVEEEITLVLVENFLPLKLGEIWKENALDIERSGIEPIPIDKELISLLIEKVDNWSLHLKNVQEKIRKNELKKKEIDEKIFYHKIKEPCLSAALDAFREMEIVSRCSERLFRLKRKFLHTKQIDTHLLDDESLLHRTYMYEIYVTPVFNQTVSIQSNINVKHNRECEMRPVSPEEGDPPLDSEPDCILTPPEPSGICEKAEFN